MENKGSNEMMQRAELHRKIWSIADNVRGAVDVWDFKQYILGILFYRFISENMVEFFNKAEYEAGVVNKLNDTDVREITLAGKLCESGDIIIEKGKLPKATEIGDIVAVTTTGAYCYTMSSNYNRMMRPAVVFVKDGKAKVAVKRETLDDLIRNDEIFDL